MLALCAISFLTGAAWSTACLRAPRFYTAARGSNVDVGSSTGSKDAALDGTNDDASFVAICVAVKVGPYVWIVVSLDCSCRVAEQMADREHALDG